MISTKYSHWYIAPKCTHLFIIGKIFFQIPKSAGGETRTWQGKKAEYKKSRNRGEILTIYYILNATFHC